MSQRSAAGHRGQSGHARLTGHGRDCLRQAKVEQLDPGLRQHHVSGLQVSVDDSLPVRTIQRVGDLDPVTQRLLERQRTLRQTTRQSLPVQVFHDEVLDTVLIAHVVEGTDVRVGQCRYCFRLPLEPQAHLGRGGEMGRKNLDRDDTFQPRVPRLVHLAHAAGPEGGKDLVRSETSAGAEGHAATCPTGRRPSWSRGRPARTFHRESAPRRGTSSCWPNTPFPLP